MVRHDMSNSASNDEWLTAAEAAALLPKVTSRTLHRWVERGDVPAVRLPGGHLRLRRSDIEALLQPSNPAGARGEQASA